MSELATQPFSLTEAEARFAASRAAWRLSLSDGGLLGHVAPLAAFALAILFAAVLGFTGLIPRRAAEIALIIAAAAFMAHRLWTRRKFWRAKRRADAWAEGLRTFGPMRVVRDGDGFWLEARDQRRGWRFADGVEVEESPEMTFVWPPRGEPLVWPVRALESPDAASAFLDGARRPKPQAAVDDDD